MGSYCSSVVLLPDVSRVLVIHAKITASTT